MGKKITLFHGTRRSVKEEDVIYCFVYREGGPPFSGSLTDNERVASDWSSPDGSLREYRYPVSNVVEFGLVAGYQSAKGYGTDDFVQPDEIQEVPPEFLEIHYLDKKHAAQQIRDGKISICRVRPEFLSRIVKG